MSFVDRYHGGAGRSGMRRYKELARDWRRRTLGRRTSLYFWTLFALTLVALLVWTSGRWRFVEGLLLGMTGMAYLLLPDALMPDHIARWQRGAWGEQSTAKALKTLRRREWLVRHDLATGYANANRDHIAVGPAVYLLDSKLLKDEVWLDQAGLHVRRLGASHEEYIVSDLTRRMGAAARALKRDLDKAVGFPVAVYPVVVIWGHFPAKAQWDGEVVYVDGDAIADWLETRPADLRDERKRAAVREWLLALPRA
ncbi:MAG: nuclease-related domain-containing protein [Gaiellaceae bacterium]